MLNRRGFEILLSLTTACRKYALYLLAYYDLRHPQVVSLGKHIKVGRDEGGGHGAVISALIKAGFLRDHGKVEDLCFRGESARLVGISPHLLLTPNDVAKLHWHVQAGKERVKLLKENPALTFAGESPRKRTANSPFNLPPTPSASRAENPSPLPNSPGS